MASIVQWCIVGDWGVMEEDKVINKKIKTKVRTDVKMSFYIRLTVNNYRSETERSSGQMP